MKSTMRARSLLLVFLAMFGLFAQRTVAQVESGGKASDILNTLFEASQKAQDSYVSLH